MSKSLGNFLTLHEALERYEPAVLRFYLLSNHYRVPLEFTDTSLIAAQAGVQRIREVLVKLDALAGKSGDGMLGNLPEQARHEIEEAMDDDCNTPRAFAAMFDFIRTLNGMLTEHELSEADAVAARGVFDMLARVFGIVPSATQDIPVDIQAMVDKRQAARDAKDWAASDALRDELAALNWTVDDTPYGPLVKRV